MRIYVRMFCRWICCVPKPEPEAAKEPDVVAR